MGGGGCGRGAGAERGGGGAAPPPALLCVLPLFAERPLFLCELCERINYPTSQLRSKLCEM